MLKHVSVLLAGGALGAGLLLATLPADAANMAVVDTARVLAESRPGKAGEAHLQKVRGVLQQGLDDLKNAYRGKENTREAQAALQSGYVALERQMAAERQAVLQVLGKALDEAVKEWRTANGKYDIVISRQTLLDSAPSVDVTGAVMKEMDKQKPQFPALPTVQVNPPEAEKKPAAEKKPDPKPAGKGAKR